MRFRYGTFCPLESHSSNVHAQPSSGARCLICGGVADAQADLILRWLPM